MYKFLVIVGLCFVFANPAQAAVTLNQPTVNANGTVSADGTFTDLVVVTITVQVQTNGGAWTPAVVCNISFMMQTYAGTTGVLPAGNYNVRSVLDNGKQSIISNVKMITIP
jgi:hypothetical protein